MAINEGLDEPLILYDKKCALCRSLASKIKTHLPTGWQIEAWQNFAKDHGLPTRADKLRVVVDREILQDREAWEFLFLNVPRLNSYHRLAARLGFRDASITIVRQAAIMMRKLCRQCGE